MIETADLYTKLETVLENTASSVTGPDGRFTQRDHVDALERYLATAHLPPDLRALLVREGAQSMSLKWHRRRRPKRDKDGNVLYHPRSVFPLGGGERVWMALATPEDGMKAALLSSVNRMRVDRADDKLQIYVRQRLLVFEQRPDLKVWDDVEREVFGYVDSDEPFSPEADDWDGDPYF